MSASIPAFPHAGHFDQAPVTVRARGGAQGSGFRFGRDWQLLLVPAILVVLRIASPPTSAMAYVVAALWALTGRRQAVLSLFFLWVFNNGSHTFCGPPMMAAVLRYVVLLAAALSVFVRGAGRNATAKVLVPASLSILLFALILGHSLVFSRTPDISVLKLLSFALAFMTALCGWAWMSPMERQRCAQIVFGSLVLIMIASLAYLVTGRAYMARSTLLAGVLVHPQTLGVAAAMSVAAFLVQTLVVRPFRWWRVVALGASMACLFLSGSRAGVLGLVAGVFVSAFYEGGRSLVSRARGNPRIVGSRLVWGTVALVLSLLFAAGPIYRSAARFIVKYGAEEEFSTTTLEKSAEARVKKIDRMLANVRRRPLEGIGFGVASDPTDFGLFARDPILGLPLMATVEKGFMPVMMIEELGVPLGSLALLWLVALGVWSGRGGLLPLAVFATAICSNFGEAAFFSSGGNGLLLILLACWAVTEPAGTRRDTASVPRPAF